MEKRKTHTSSAVKRRYNQKTYTTITLSLHKDIAAAYKAKCEALGISYSQPLHEAVQAFLNNRTN